MFNIFYYFYNKYKRKKQAELLTYSLPKYKIMEGYRITENNNIEPYKYIETTY